MYTGTPERMMQYLPNANEKNNMQHKEEETIEKCHLYESWLQQILISFSCATNPTTVIDNCDYVQSTDERTEKKNVSNHKICHKFLSLHFFPYISFLSCH